MFAVIKETSRKAAARLKATFAKGFILKNSEDEREGEGE